MKKSTRSFLQKPSTTGVLIGVLAIAFSVVGLLLVQTPLEEPQDVRRQASIDRGEVTVSHSVQPSEFYVGQTNNVMLSVNTAGVPTDGIQVLFNVVTDTFDTMNVDVITEGGLQAAGTQVERTEDGFLVQALALPATIGQPFVTTGDISPVFLKVSFIPTKTGTVAFNFDREESISILHGSDPLQDKLNHIDPFEITITEDGDPGASPSPSPSTSPSPSPSPSPDARGGIQVVGCNVECSSNAECGINQRCYNVDGTNRCRLAVNPTNDRCITADTGPNYSCNQGCADTHECETGLVCWYNQCRDPLNVEDTSCSALSDEETESLASSCNVACQSNNDCDINLRCYQGACRLVTNPSSSTCSPAIMSTISSTYATPKGGAQDASDTSDDEAMEAPVEDETATATGETTDSVDETPTTDTGAMKVQPIGMTDEEEATVANETALDVLLKMMRTPDSALPLIVIGAGIGLLVIALIVILLRRMTGNNQPTPVKPAATAPVKTQPTEPVQSRKDLDTPLTTARSMTTPTASMPTRSTLERQSSQAAQTPTQPQASSQGMPPATTQPSASGDSSMLQRMKNKGISVPNTSAGPEEKQS